MIIVLEGPDLAGKSTLARALQSHAESSGITAKINKCGPLKRDPIDEYLVPLVDMTMTNPTESLWILDRHHVGERIYGPILRGSSKLTPAQWAYVELVLDTMCAVKVHVTASVNTLHTRYDERGDELLTWDQIRNAWLRYHDILGFERKDYVTIVTEGHDAYTMNLVMLENKLTAALEAIADRERQFRKTTAHAIKYIGSMRPSVLLLGDQQGTGNFAKRHDPVPWPFVPRAGTSGHWLMQSLVVAGVDIGTIGLVNGNEQPPHGLASLWKMLDAPPVVALGANAKDAADEAGVPVTLRLNHPQYERRFRFGDQMEYGESIKGVMR